MLCSLLGSEVLLLKYQNTRELDTQGGMHEITKQMAHRRCDVSIFKCKDYV